MKKSLLAVLLLAFAMLTGCSAEQKLKINSDFTSVSQEDIYTTAEEEEAIMQMLTDGEQALDMTYEEFMKEMGYTFAGTAVVDGVTNNIYSANAELSAVETKAKFLVLDKERALYNISSTTGEETTVPEDTEDAEDAVGFSYLTITYPFAVGKANGEIQSDGCTVKYDVLALNKQKVTRVYALSKSVLAAADKITVKGVKDKKAYRRSVTVQVSAKSVVTTFMVNGKKQPINRYNASTDGKYKVVVKTATGMTKKVNFCVDTKKPNTNIKNKKTYKKPVKIKFNDKVSGIKKATLNGRKIKYGKTVKKNGTYTLKIYDKAGNVTKVKFKIKK